MNDGQIFAAALIAQTTEAILVIDASGTVILVNEAGTELFDMTADQILGENIVDWVHPQDLHRAATVMAGVTDGAKPRPGLIKVRHVDGWMTLEISAGPINVTAPDGTASVVTMLLLRDSVFQETHWNFLAAVSGDLPFVDCIEILARGLSDGPDGPMAINYATMPATDSDLRLERALHDDLGHDDFGHDDFSHDDLDHEDNENDDRRSLGGGLPRRLGALTHEGLIDRTEGTPWAIALETGRPAWALIENLPDDVRQLAVDRSLKACVVVPVPDPGHDLPALMIQWPIWTTMTEVIAEALIRRPHQALSLALERRFAMNRLEHLAHHDGLTGLVNRERFFETLRGHESAGRPIAVFYIDLDQFKPINDTLGHHIGDRVIAACANRLRHLSRPVDVVGRLGGDEFALGCPGMDTDSAEAMASRIVNALAAPIALSTGVVEIGASVGCTVSLPGQTIEAVVAVADAALYGAKRAGRKRWNRH